MYLLLYIIISISLGYIDYRKEKRTKSVASIWDAMTTSFIGVGLVMGAGYIFKYIF